MKLDLRKITHGQYVRDLDDLCYDTKRSVSFNSYPKKYCKKNNKKRILKQMIRGRRVCVCSPRAESCEVGGYNKESERFYIEEAMRTIGLANDFEHNVQYIEQNIKVIDNRTRYHSYSSSCILGRRRY